MHRPDGHGPRGRRLPCGENDANQSAAAHRHEGSLNMWKFFNVSGETCKLGG